MSSNEKQKKPLPWQLPAYIFRRTQISCLTAIVLFWFPFDSCGIPRRIISPPARISAQSPRIKSSSHLCRQEAAMLKTVSHGVNGPNSCNSLCSVCSPAEPLYEDEPRCQKHRITGVKLQIIPKNKVAEASKHESVRYVRMCPGIYSIQVHTVLIIISMTVIR